MSYFFLLYIYIFIYYGIHWEWIKEILVFVIFNFILKIYKIPWQLTTGFARLMFFKVNNKIYLFNCRAHIGAIVVKRTISTENNASLPSVCFSKVYFCWREYDNAFFLSLKLQCFCVNLHFPIQNGLFIQCID